MGLGLGDRGEQGSWRCGAAWALVSSIATLTRWLWKEKQQVRFGVICCPCLFPACWGLIAVEDSPPSTASCSGTSTDPTTPLFLISERDVSGGEWTRVVPCWASPLQAPLP